MPTAGEGAAPAVDSIPVDGASQPAPEIAGEEESRGGGLSIEQIVVTAQKREEAINDVPVSISAFSGDELQALGVTDTRDLAAIVPGFTAADNGYNTPIYTLRGIGFADTTYTATSTVGVYVDEVSLPYGIMTKGANLDLKRVEVLKGPQGTLYGRNTTGGAINYIANKPTDGFEYGVKAGYGRFQTRELEGFISGGFTDTLRGRLAVRTIQSEDGWQYSRTRPGDHLGKKNKQSGRGILEWEPTSSLQVDLTLSGWVDRSDAQAAQAIAIQKQNPFIPNSPFDAQFPILGPIIGVNPAFAPQIRDYPLVPADTNSTRVSDWNPLTRWRLDDNFWSAASRVRWNLTDDTTLTGIASYGDVASDGSAIPNSGTNVYNVEQIITAGIKASNIELRLDGKAFEDAKWMIGVNGSHDKGGESHYSFVDTNSAVFPDPITGTGTLTTRSLTAGRTKADTFGVFANGEMPIMDTLKFTVGARYSDEKRTSFNCTSDAPGGGGIGISPVFSLLNLINGGAPTVLNRGDCFQLGDEPGEGNGAYTGKLKEHNVSGRASLDWKPLDDTLLYVSYARGFKSGGFPVLNSSYQAQSAPTTQEKLLATEVGAKTTLIESVLQINGAGFYYDYKDKQLLTFFKDPVFGVLPILDNIPKSTVYGFETDLQYAPAKGLFLTAAGSYIHTRVDKYVGINSDGDTFDYKGRPFNYTAKWQYTLLGDYSFPVNGGLNMGFGADYSYTGKTNATLEEGPNYRMRSAGLTNVRVRIESSKGTWSAMAWGRNVFNEFSQVGVFRTGDTVARTTGMPVTYGLTVSWNGF